MEYIGRRFWLKKNKKQENNNSILFHCTKTIYSSFHQKFYNKEMPKAQKKVCYKTEFLRKQLRILLFNSPICDIVVRNVQTEPNKILSNLLPIYSLGIMVRVRFVSRQCGIYLEGRIRCPFSGDGSTGKICFETRNQLGNACVPWKCGNCHMHQ